MARYSKKASEKVEAAMHEKKQGTLRSGRSGNKVTSRKQAIAIGLSEARTEGAKVPVKKGARKSAKKSASKRSTAKNSGSGKKAAGKKAAKKTARKKPGRPAKKGRSKA